MLTRRTLIRSWKAQQWDWIVKNDWRSLKFFSSFTILWVWDQFESFYDSLIFQSLPKILLNYRFTIFINFWHQNWLDIIWCPHMVYCCIIHSFLGKSFIWEPSKSNEFSKTQSSKDREKESNKAALGWFGKYTSKTLDQLKNPKKCWQSAIYHVHCTI